jgi:hypothetical protein
MKQSFLDIMGISTRLEALRGAVAKFHSVADDGRKTRVDVRMHLLVELLTSTLIFV